MSGTGWQKLTERWKFIVSVLLGVGITYFFWKDAPAEKEVDFYVTYGDSSEFFIAGEQRTIPLRVRGRQARIDALNAAIKEDPTRYPVQACYPSGDGAEGCKLNPTVKMDETDVRVRLPDLHRRHRVEFLDHDKTVRVRTTKAVKITVRVFAETTGRPAEGYNVGELAVEPEEIELFVPEGQTLDFISTDTVSVEGKQHEVREAVSLTYSDPLVRAMNDASSNLEPAAATTRFVATIPIRPDQRVVLLPPILVELVGQAEGERLEPPYATVLLRVPTGVEVDASRVRIRLRADRVQTGAGEGRVIALPTDFMSFVSGFPAVDENPVTIQDVQPRQFTVVAPAPAAP